jgi:hypothetical protein
MLFREVIALYFLIIQQKYMHYMQRIQGHIVLKHVLYIYTAGLKSGNYMQQSCRDLL